MKSSFLFIIPNQVATIHMTETHVMDKIQYLKSIRQIVKSLPQSNFPITKQELFPPKAKPLFKTILTLFIFALFGTQSTSHSGSGVSKFIVGGIIFSLTTRQQVNASIPDAAPMV